MMALGSKSMLTYAIMASFKEDFDFTLSLFEALASAASSAERKHRSYAAAVLTHSRLGYLVAQTGLEPAIS